MYEAAVLNIIRDDTETKPFHVENNTDSVFMMVEDMVEQEETEDERDSRSSEKSYRRGGYCEIKYLEA